MLPGCGRNVETASECQLHITACLVVTNMLVAVNGELPARTGFGTMQLSLFSGAFLCELCELRFIV